MGSYSFGWISQTKALNRDQLDGQVDVLCQMALTQSNDRLDWNRGCVQSIVIAAFDTAAAKAQFVRKADLF
ncbi:hypothetical protein ACMAZE_00025 [Pseudopelagicola sp. nBUS_20]|uniref:hypothetical protein n=1 Tax=Pseudopelagicola sp. nBUS_20 TaxID=3395317 RepID=UPI003EB954E3